MGAAKLAAQHLHEVATVEQAGQHVLGRLITQFIAQTHVGDGQADVLGALDGEAARVQGLRVGRLAFRCVIELDVQEANGVAVRDDRQADVVLLGVARHLVFDVGTRHGDRARAELVRPAAAQGPTRIWLDVIDRTRSVPVAGAIKDVARIAVDIELARRLWQDASHESGDDLEQFSERLAGLQPLVEFREQRHLALTHLLADQGLLGALLGFFGAVHGRG